MDGTTIMPFNRDGIWEEPTQEDIAEFTANLESTETKQVSTKIPENLMNKLESGISQSNIEVLAKTNKTRLETIKTLAKKGFSKVDIIIPVYGGIHVLDKCLESIEKCTNWPYEITLVNDATDDGGITKMHLNNLYGNKYKVLHNNKNRGFAATVNRGLKATENKYACILNSDTVVTPNWLTKMVLALESDPNTQIVNPVTNNTALINVDMYPGQSYLDMNRALEKTSRQAYPEIMPTGFCFMFKRELLNEIDYFDEAYGSYGEETDFWFRTINHVKDGLLQKYKAVLADDTYIFHERGTSFSQLGTDEHIGLRRGGSERFHKIHPNFKVWRQTYDVESAVGGLRQNLTPQAFLDDSKEMNVAFVVKSTGACGGMNYIADIANDLIDKNFNVKICCIPDPTSTNMGLVSSLRTMPIYFENEEDFIKKFSSVCFNEGVVFAAVTDVTPAVKELSDTHANITGINHVQSYDPLLAIMSGAGDEVSEDRLKRLISLPCVTASGWVADEITSAGGTVLANVLPGVDTNLFYDRGRNNGDDRFTVAVSLNTSYPFKGSDRGLELCKKIHEKALKLNQEVRILGLGCDAVKQAPYITCLGTVSQSRWAHLLGREIDVFVDPSHIHSYGMPILEALVSGVRVVTWDNMGVNEYAKEAGHNQIEIFNEDADVDDLVESIFKEVTPSTGRFTQKRSKSIDYFEEVVNHFRVKPKHRVSIEVITPHLRKHGGPTTNICLANNLEKLNHNVEIASCYPDFNPEVIAQSNVPIRQDWSSMAPKEVMIINSDNPFAPQIMKEHPDSKFIMYKLSHNMRFKETEESNLKLNWNHIITSTDWLRNVCVKDFSWPGNKVTTVGWYHYGHSIFKMPPQNRTYNNLDTGIKIGLLMHQHPLKGSKDALTICKSLKKKYGTQVQIVAFGECQVQLDPWVQYFYNCTRPEMAAVMQQLDIWVGASHTEGLGRLALEAMSAGVAVVTTDTGAEFLKNGDNCLLYDIGDLRAGAALTDQIIQNDDLRTKLVVNGYNTAVESSNPERFRSNLQSVIQEVMK